MASLHDIRNGGQPGGLVGSRARGAACVPHIRVSAAAAAGVALMPGLLPSPSRPLKLDVMTARY